MIDTLSESPHLDKDHPRTANDEKEAHRQLVDWTDDDLKQVPLLPAGARLEPARRTSTCATRRGARSRPPARCRSRATACMSPAPRSMNGPGTGC